VRGSGRGDFVDIVGCQHYEGTGVVAEVVVHPQRWEKAQVAFAPPYPPREYVHLLLVRDNQIVGKVKVGSPSGSVSVLEGSPRVGDLVIGIQNDPNYERTLENFGP
jgi:hypothetical protein